MNVPSHMFGSKIEDNFEFGINWKKPYIINVKYQKCVHPNLKRSGDTSYIGPCTNVNEDGVLKLQHYQDTYISHYTKLAVKRATKLHIDSHLKSSNYVHLEPV